MNLSRAARIGVVLGFVVGLTGAFVVGARPEIALLRALGCAFGTALLMILAQALNSVPVRADKRSGEPAGRTTR